MVARRAHQEAPVPGAAVVTHRVLGALAAVVLVLHAGHYLDVWTDDAFITFRYARMLADGHGMVFNVGEHVEGITNLGWALVLALFGDGDLLRPARTLGVLAAAGTVLALAEWARESDLSPAATGAGLASLVLAPWLPYWSVQGMETPVAAALLTLGWTRYAARDAAGSAAGLGLAPWVRPDGALVVLVVAAWHALGRRWDRAHALGAAAIGLSALALVGAKLAWFGEVFPNTFHVKTGGTGRGLEYVWSFLTAPSAGLPILVLLACAAGLRRARDDRALPGLLFLLGLGAAVLQDGDFMANYRLLVPLWPAACAALAIAVHDLGRARWAALAVTLLACAPLARADALDGLDRPDHGAFPNKTSLLAHPEPLRGRMPFAEAWALVHAADPVAHTDVGMLGFLNEIRVIDLLALTDPVMAGRHGETWVDQWAYLREQATWMILESPDGQWGRYRDALADDGWTVQARCEAIWVFRNPRATPTAVTDLDERLADARRRVPDFPGLHVTLATELAATGASGLDDQVDWIEARWPDHAYVQGLRCTTGLEGECPPPHTVCGTSQTRWDVEALAQPESWPGARDDGLAPQDPEQAPLDPDALVDPSADPPKGPGVPVTPPLPELQAQACDDAIRSATQAWTDVAAHQDDPERMRLARRAAAQARAGGEAARTASAAAHEALGSDAAHQAVEEMLETCRRRQ